MEFNEKMNEIFSRHQPKREMAIPVLQDIQGEFGYLQAEAMEKAAQYCRMSPVELYGVATFYAQFKFSPVGKHRIMVCQGTACHVMGGARILEEVQNQLDVGTGETTVDKMFTLETVACIGACALAPAIVVNKDTHGKVKPEEITEILDETRKI